MGSSLYNELHRAPCPQCGATTVKEAEGKCTPQSMGETGEYECPGEDTDAEGFILQPTPQAIAALDAWVDEQVAEEQRIEAAMNDIDPGCWGNPDRWHAARDKAERRLGISS